MKRESKATQSSSANLSTPHDFRLVGGPDDPKRGYYCVKCGKQMNNVGAICAAKRT